MGKKGKIGFWIYVLILLVLIFLDYNFWLVLGGIITFVCIFVLMVSVSIYFIHGSETAYKEKERRLVKEYLGAESEEAELSQGMYEGLLAHEVSEWEKAIKTRSFLLLTQFYKEHYNSLVANFSHLRVIQSISTGNWETLMGGRLGWIKERKELAEYIHDGSVGLNVECFTKASNYLEHHKNNFKLLKDFKLLNIKLLKDYTDERIYSINAFNQYQTYINHFYSSLKQKQYNDAFNYYLDAEPYKIKIKDKKSFFNKSDENKLNSNISIVVFSLTKKIRKTTLNLSTKFTRIEIREIGEKCGIDNKSLIIKVVKDMIKNKEIYAEYFKSSNSISFDQQSNIDEIDKLMATYKEWEKKGKGKSK